MKITRLRIAERLTGAIAMLVGAAALLGWVLDLPVLKSVMPGMATMKSTSAFCFILSGAVFLIGLSGVTAARAKPVAMVCSALVLLAGTLTLIEYLFGWNPGLDQALFRDNAAGTSYPGRMAPPTAVAFVLLNIALLLLRGRSSRVRQGVVGLLGTLTVLLGLSAVLGWTGNVNVGYQPHPRDREEDGPPLAAAGTVS
jgi:hypothetical protein